MTSPIPPHAPDSPHQPGFVPPGVPQAPVVEQKKNWCARHKVLTGCLAVMALLIGVVAVSGGETSPGAEAAQDATGVTAGATDEGGGDAGESKASDPSVDGPQGFVIGDVATAGDMSYTVTGVDTAASVGSSFLEEKAKGMYLIVSVEVTNNGNEAVMIDDSFFTLKNGDKSYDADSMASMTANSDDSGNSSFFLENINPDVTMAGNVVFDVSKDIATAHDNRIEAQTGFWGTETVEIALTQ